MQKKVFTLIFAVMLACVCAFAFAGCGKTEGGGSGGGGDVVKEFTVTFDSDGGTDVASVTVKEGERVAKPATPIKASIDKQYKFVGWFNGDKEWNFNTDVVDGNLTLTARWVLREEYTKVYPPKS